MISVSVESGIIFITVDGETAAIPLWLLRDAEELPWHTPEDDHSNSNQ